MKFIQTTLVLLLLASLVSPCTHAELCERHYESWHKLFDIPQCRGCLRHAETACAKPDCFTLTPKPSMTTPANCGVFLFECGERADVSPCNQGKPYASVRFLQTIQLLI